MTGDQAQLGETAGMEPSGASALLPSVVQALREMGLTVDAYARQFWADGGWYGDVCGCSDDRCVGFHHDAASDCGCFPVLLDQARDQVASHDHPSTQVTAGQVPAEVPVSESVAELREAEL